MSDHDKTKQAARDVAERSRLEIAETSAMIADCKRSIAEQFKTAVESRVNREAGAAE